MRYWLMKSEPDTYSIDNLKGDGIGHWDGVRNYQVRNMMRDDMSKGDQAFFYHSNCKNPGIAGIMTISRNAYPDFTAWDNTSKYYDPKSNERNPQWLMVDVTYKRNLARFISLTELKQHTQLAGMLILRRGNRLSITPITENEWNFILQLEQQT
ncbi:MAG: EVE domain-containing protein [Gammaproteobacteria bacterium]|nr:EVE domain-containing protein [Gammaproteobacteria bacterium]